MVRGNFKINLINLFSVVSIVFILGMTIGSIIVVFLWSDDKFSIITSYELIILIFTLKQAFISAFLSCAFAVPIAKAIFRKNFFFKEFFIKILVLPFIFPVISAIFCIILIFGNNGFINLILELLGFSKISIYGLKGIIIINLFFNLPLAVRLLLLAWSEIPNEQFKLASSLNFKPLDFFRFIEFPMLRSTLPSTALIIFLICVTSFSVVLALGGGPNSTTLEVAIYQAIRFEFDFTKAATLASIQFLVCASLAILILFFGQKNISSVSNEINPLKVNTVLFKSNLFDYFWIILSILFFLFPIFYLILSYLLGIFFLPISILLATLNSLIIAIFSGLMGVLLAFFISIWVISLNFYNKYIEVLSIFILGTSPIVMGAGLYLILRPLLYLESLSIILVILVNATMSLPFMLRSLLPAIIKVEDDYGKLATSLNIDGFDRIQIIIFPRIIPSLAFCFGLGCSLSMGDLGVITLFSFGDFQTLPLAIYRLMMSYRLEQAFSSSVLLIIICLFLFYFCDFLGKFYAPCK